jgi:hypothetical protein
MGVRWFAVVTAVCACLSATAGCGEDEKPLFDPGTFTGMHEAEIRNDCKQSLQCRAQMGQEVPSEDPIGQCLHDSAERIESSTDIQDSFLRKYGRCMNYVVCDYYACATSNVTGYGDTQKDKVVHSCQAEIDCAVMQGTFTGMRDKAMNSCVFTKTGGLDNFTQMQRMQYEATYAGCAALTGCMFTSCFNNGMGVTTQ